MQQPRSTTGVVDAAVGHLHRPGLLVLAGPPGCGRSTTLDGIAAAQTGAVHRGGGLAMLTGVPALALSRAVRARLPGHDAPLLAEAVRSRVRGGLLLLDDVQYADPVTLAALPHLAGHCRVVVALRTPHRLGAAEQTLRAAATAWLTVPPWEPAAAADLVRRTAPHLDGAAVRHVVARAGGTPLAITALARHAAAGRGAAGGDVDQVAYALAAALADLPRSARTAMAALGLLGRPAPPALLGEGAAALLAAGLITADPGGQLHAVSGYVAEVAAGLLDADARTDLHRRLADLTAPAQAARHLAAAGDHRAAYRLALHAADAGTGGERADLLLFACSLPGVAADPRVRLAAADAALSAGRPHTAVQVLDAAVVPGADADVLRGEAHLQAGDPAAARAAVQTVPDAAGAAVLAARDRILLLAELATDPAAAADTADKVAARYPRPPGPVAAALAAVRAAHRNPGWEVELAAAAQGSDPLTARWSAWLLVEHLTADARLTEAADAARRAAETCADDLAYSWQTRFLGVAHWATALHAGTTHPSATDPRITPTPTMAARAVPAAGADDQRDAAHRRAADLADRSLPAVARGHAVAAAALVEADTGLLATASARLTAAADVAEHPAVAWVIRETAWLDGRPEHTVPALTASGLLDGLHHITARWSAHEAGTPPTAPAIPTGLPLPARRTLTAWATGTGFAAAADTWRDTIVRERVRCLLAAGILDDDPARAVPALLTAEDLATAAGLSVLAGRARRALRRHHVHRDTRGPRSGTDLTARERDVLRLVAAGEPTRRIAGQLGISAETVDTHVRAGMRKLGARTRTEAAALAFAPHPPGDDR